MRDWRAVGAAHGLGTLIVLGDSPGDVAARLPDATRCYRKSRPFLVVMLQRWTNGAWRSIGAFPNWYEAPGASATLFDEDK